MLLVEFVQLFYCDNTFLLKKFLKLLELVIYLLVVLLFCSETPYLKKLVTEQCL